MSSISMPKQKFIDRVNYYLPKTMGQFKASPSEKLNRPSGGTKKERRAYCRRHLIINIFLSPFQVAGLIAWNSGNAVKKTGSIVATTFILPWKFSENKAYWVKTALRISDFVIAMATSPLQPIITCSRLIAGMIKPETYFREPLLLNDRINHDLHTNDFKIEDIPEDYAANKRVLANRALISSLYNYSARWGLIDSSEISPCSLLGSHSKGFFETRKLLNRLLSKLNF
jgi:hypothetical protein